MSACCFSLHVCSLRGELTDTTGRGRAGGSTVEVQTLKFELTDKSIHWNVAPGIYPTVEADGSKPELPDKSHHARVVQCVFTRSDRSFVW